MNIKRRAKELAAGVAELDTLNPTIRRTVVEAVTQLATEVAEEKQREIDRLQAIIGRIDTYAPRADKTCIRPGITLSQAAANMLRDEGHELFR